MMFDTFKTDNRSFAEESFLANRPAHISYTFTCVQQICSCPSWSGSCRKFDEQRKRRRARGGGLLTSLENEAV